MKIPATDDPLGRVVQPRPPLRRVAMLSVHTSPLDQPGTGDAGGMNVYIVELARQLARSGIEVEVFTRATCGDLPPAIEIEPGVLVRNVVAGPFEGLAKADLPGQLCTFARDVLRTEAVHEPGHYDVVHSHYWLSGQVGALARDRWRVPLVHSMHTMAKVKNRLLADGDAEEPGCRLIGEQQVVDAADLLVANTTAEASQLVGLYDAEPGRVRVISPGVDLDVFCAGDPAGARRRLGVAPDAVVVMFVGRIQPLKAPDIVIRAAAELLDRSPGLRGRLVVPIIGGPSGSGFDTPQSLAALAARLGLADVVRLVPPQRQHDLADWYRAATTVVVPSYNESFGLVAIEAQACGTPVIASRVGGLTTAVIDGATGLLLDSHDPAEYASAIEKVVTSPGLRSAMGVKAVTHAREFGWARTAEQTIAAYDAASRMMRAHAVAALVP
ncbi:MAG TPA: D-inositol-3-phosphate glycosyltransferase [Nocardioidaceae bacterium]|nr:D-inositol-3-phosphate glycosyltransferase [Nocardioidaceae bacterium]